MATHCYSNAISSLPTYVQMLFGVAWFISGCRLSPPKTNDSPKYFCVRRLSVRRPTENLQAVIAKCVSCATHFVLILADQEHDEERLTDLPDVRLNVLPIVLGSSGRGDNQFTKEPTSGTCRNRPLWRQTQSYSWAMIISVVLKRTVVIGDWLFDNLSESHLQSQLNSVCQSMLL